MPSSQETTEILHSNRHHLVSLGNYSEADTVLYLIDPVMDYLGYPSIYQARENQQNKNRPDIVFWDVPASLHKMKPANGIVEAKPLKHDLEGKGIPRADRPKNQIKRYLSGHPFSATGTYGILTDGNIWHMMRRGEDPRQAQFVKEWRLVDGTKEETALYLQEIEEILKGSSPTGPTSAANTKNQKAKKICEAMATGKPPSDVLELITEVENSRNTLEGQVNLQGKAREATQSQWQRYAYGEGGKVKAEQKDLSNEAVAVAVVQATNAESEWDRPLYRTDTAIAAETFAQAVPIKMSVVLMIQPDEEGNSNTARLAIHYQGHTGMTTEFNPNTPSPMTLGTIQKVCDMLDRKNPVLAQNLAAVVGAKGVREEFYKKIAGGWTLTQQRKAKGGDKKRHQYREAVLRHLIRTIFAWILKEDGKLPPEPFDEAFATREAPGQYHRNILAFLFHERLNRPEKDRKPHQNPEINMVMETARFLNGSLFAQHQGDELLEMNDQDYFGTGNNPGLFTILNEYEWTASEHTPESSDQTIDPEVLSNLFENLITATTYGQEVPERMPEGTYYTPSDIAQEMVKDALTEAIQPYAPAQWPKADLRKLFGEEYPELPTVTPMEKNSLIGRIKELTIFDPAVGSGEFPLTMVLAIRKALKNLGVDQTDDKLTREIISRQIFAQDINPMAVQVTRLRLFIAIMAAEVDQITNMEPLPNLEARIVCADTLRTRATREWSPAGSGTLQSTITEITDALDGVTKVRERWITAHDEEAKQALRLEDENARKELMKALRGQMANPETNLFAKHALLNTETPPAEFDTRLLFYHQNWTGFDIVIGNPPYCSTSKYLDGTSKQRNKILSGRGYKTTAGNDMYNLIAETGLNLTKAEGGVIALIVPLSICFGQDQVDTRKLFESECDLIALRSQDIRPDKSFHNSPVAHPPNSSRTTIITARTGPGHPRIEITGTNKWLKSERYEYLTSREIPLARTTGRSVNAKLDTQWERIPTQEIQELINKMKKCTLKVSDLSMPGENDFSIGFPESSRYFVTTVPSGKLNRGETLIAISDEENLKIAMAATNGNAAYAWWKAYGDAFHVNPHEIETIPIPNLWLQETQMKSEACRLGKELIDTIKEENIKKKITGTNSKEQDSLNFHTCAPDTIRAIDKLYLKALGLEENPLLNQLRMLSNESTWRLGVEENAK